MEVTCPRMQQSVYPHSREWTVDFGYNAPESLDRMKGSRLASLPLFRASLSKGSNQQRVRPRLTTRCLTVVANATKTLPLLLPGTRLPARWPFPASLAVWWCACLANNSEQKEECHHLSALGSGCASSKHSPHYCQPEPLTSQSLSFDLLKERPSKVMKGTWVPEYGTLPT